MMPGTTSDACSVSKNIHHDEVTTWYFSREEIEKNSPSRRDGIDLKIETFLRKSYCTFLRKLADELKVPRITLATAIVFCNRFFSRQSHAKNDRWIIATICMFLAGKVEDTRFSLKDVIVSSYEIIHKKKLDADQRKKVYEEQKELVLSGEELVLSTLNFDLTVHHPYEALAYAIKKYKPEKANAEFSKLAQGLVDYCLGTALCLQYKPHHLAAYGYIVAATHLEINLQEYEKGLYEEFNITPRQIEDMNGQMAEHTKDDSNESGTQNPDDNPVQEGTGKASESEA